jgi:hypothetical protein
VGCSGTRDRDDEPRVVLELAVPRQQPAAQAREAHSGHQGEGLGVGELPRPREGVPGGSDGQPQHVPGGESRARQGRLASRHDGEQRQDHGQRAAQVRGGARHQHVPLHRALVSDPELPLGEVAQASVDELGAPAGRAEGEVVRVDRGHRQAP